MKTVSVPCEGHLIQEIDEVSSFVTKLLYLKEYYCEQFMIKLLRTSLVDNTVVVTD